MKSRFFDPPRPRLFGHRGASAHFPENTLPAFLAAVRAGISYLEMDVHVTGDGHVVVHHDADLQRTCGDSRRIADLSLAEVQALDAGWTFSTDRGRTFPFRGTGVTVPTLTEVIACCPGVLFNIEIKQAYPAIEEEVLAVLRRAGKEEEVLLAAESDAVMERLRPMCGEIPTGCSLSEIAAFMGWTRSGCRGEFRTVGRALQIPEIYGDLCLVTPDSLRAAHAAGLEIHVWTVNDPAEMKSLLDLGVDGIMSDFPEILAEVQGQFTRSN